jgi:hypothetical protein
MTDGIIVQYVGFQAKPFAREYTFHVRKAGEDREFTLNIENEAFVSHRARYQDAPDICAQRLQAELAAHANHPPETQYVITGAELDVYRASRTAAKSTRGPYGRKAEENL